MDAFSMGSYGVYVWSCFALTVVVVVLMDWSSRRRQKRIFRDIEVQIKALEDRQ